MIPEQIHKKALGLFEKGHYTECLGFIHGLSPGERDVPIRILEAVSLIETGSIDDAEVCLRDLRVTVPDSAEVCIYLGRILKERGDDEARAVFSDAVCLDPDNRDGLLWYAEYVMSQEDYSAAIPVLNRLYTLSENSRDLCRLMDAHLRNENPEEAIQLYLHNNRPSCCRPEYLRALSEAGRVEEIFSEINPEKNPSDDEFVLLVRAITGLSPEKADSVILPRIARTGTIPVIVEYVRLLQVQKRDREAAGVCSTYLSGITDPGVRTLICSSLLRLGELPRAEEIYKSVLFPDPPVASADDIMRWLNEYLEIVRLNHQSEEDLMEKAGQVLHPSYAAFAGLCAERTGRHDLAHQYFQKAFRSDIVKGGLLYAAYLERTGNMREWEKIITYILKNTGKVRDLEFVAASALENISENVNLLHFLHDKFQKCLPVSSTRGKRIFCQVAGLLASEELKNGRYGEGMILCLKALAHVPAQEKKMADHLFSLLMSCKTPGLPVRYTFDNPEQEKSNFSRSLTIPGLTSAEEAVLQYMRRHLVCSELELRTVCGTKRIAGLMNRLMRKTSAGGWQILMKEGITESGEVYRYAGP
ncbi:tetratricopeptide repeat protein [Methanospirillum stamsii]|uniref:Tetratricopeptide repeat protein n=1 Tax=Methanospirillum stamsii TaxID=1277351 RepID=A0A2V2N8Z5_9EURY|nr:tetratricopeptide repeat protein [Methanospirillum stamsii]PWR75160.1 hypothetical protein DLD82_06150 [Methanospirillum stamsii]